MSSNTTIPKHLAIEILYADDSVIVINKPPHLRSVPGHANPPSSSNDNGDAGPGGGGADTDASSRKRKRSDATDGTSATKAKGERRTAQEGWMEAIKSFSPEGRSNDRGKHDETDDDRAVNSFLQKLSSFSKNGIPRKKKLFTKYANRNRQRLFDGEANKKDLSDLEAGNRPTNMNINKIAEVAFGRIKERQIPLLNLPEQTKDEESAQGQLKVLGYEDLRKILNYDAKVETHDPNEKQQDNDTDDGSRQYTSKIRVVHRLDCETSGIMVYARTDEAASKLCEAWRNRDGVKKYYLARVKRWPPYQIDGKESGLIDLALAPSEERLKWKVVKEGDGGKPSQTLWSLYKLRGQKASNGGDDSCMPATLELQPITGRTHQLRIHCAAIGSGIEGDTLYGDEPIEWDGLVESANHTLCLHAHKLHFPHPKTGKQMEFTTKPAWL